MNHDDALRLSATERYLLKDLDEDLRDQFEEHFFECAECATDVRSGAAMLDQMRVELARPDAAGDQEKLELRIVPAGRKTPFFLRPAWAVGAIAAMLLVIAYQNIVEMPRLKNEVASMTAPEVLPSLSLVNGVSRADKLPSVTVSGHKRVLLTVDIPTEDRFSSYLLSLYTPDGKSSGSIPVTAQEAKDSVSFQVAAAKVQPGTSTLVIQGIPSAPPGSAPVEIERKQFQIDNRN